VPNNPAPRWRPSPELIAAVAHLLRQVAARQPQTHLKVTASRSPKETRKLSR
jgi:hypothetical protein